MLIPVRKLLLHLFALVFLMPCIPAAHSTEPAKENAADPAKMTQDAQRQNEIQALLANGNHVTPIEVPQSTSSHPLSDEYKEYVKAQLEYDIWTLKQRRWVYEWQFWAGIMVFLVSMLVVILGMYMSWLQFDTYN